jgi:hypothetical protein
MLRLVARACKEILVDGTQFDSVLARFREETGNKVDSIQLYADVVSVIKHHGLLNYIITNAGRGIEGMLVKDEERHFVFACILFHVFKGRIEKGVYSRFSEAEKENIASFLKKLSPRLDAATMALVENAIRLDIPAMVSDMDVLERMSILYSHPSWYVEQLHRLLPADRVESILRAQQSPQSFFIVTRNGNALDHVTKFLVSKSIAFQYDRTFPNVLNVSNLGGAKHRIIEAA